MARIFLFLIGFGFVVIGLSNIILYLNLLTIGYNFYEYVNFIIKSNLLYLVIIGIIIIVLTLINKGDRKYELYLWYYFKF